MYDITGGNPFYILELLKTMFAQGLLATDERGGEWSAPVGALESGTVFPLSRTVQEVIAERVDRLPEELAEVLITVSVAGGTGCRPEVLSHVHGISRLHAAAVCDALVDRRLLVEDGGAYRAAHPVIGHVVRDGLTAPRRREVHRMLALSLELASPPGADLGNRRRDRPACRPGRGALARLPGCPGRQSGGPGADRLCRVVVVARSRGRVGHGGGGAG